MGIYIKDMKMPTNCDDCLLGSDCPHDQSIDGYKMQGGRPHTCPLVPVPPHGRLIDADALLSKDYQVYNEYGDAIGRRYLSVYDIQEAPTIIPVEENTDI